MSDGGGQYNDNRKNPCKKFLKSVKPDLFNKKAGYITQEWYPYFLAARRDGMMFVYRRCYPNNRKSVLFL